MERLNSNAHRVSLIKRSFLVIGIAASGLIAVSAHACDLSDGGFLAAVGKCVAPQATPLFNAADQFNAQTKIAERAAIAGANAIYPGAGNVLGAGMALQQAGAFSGGAGFQPRPMPPIGPLPAPMGGMPPFGQPSFGGVPFPAPMPAPMAQPFQPPMTVAMGTHCAAPNFGVVPTMPAPVGSFCVLPTPIGAVQGRMVY
ncbi:hypothetical protein [Caballeronia sp. ATUFL_F1_KS39]|uniref:hypothetical protein n=1 Tax=Caballeronia sp. ATUFL_F1_KS39 TaxID=2921766 RepID=UPI00202852D6|nr:hypothetical protein [Caballeronia sp. ATUFL_F1_KS39]